MREWLDITAAFAALCDAGLPSALATVVCVEGSAYRRPGARMLVAEDGRTWGGVSGGCLERDVAARARGVIAAGRAFLQRYDTTDEELIERGVSTGCGGTIDVLIQPLSADRSGVLTAIASVLRTRQSRIVATVIRADPAASHVLGHTFDDAAGRFAPPPAGGRAYAELESPGGRVTVLVERLTPPLRLVVVGGGPDAVPVLAIAKTLGWHVAVVAAAPALNAVTRFADADELHVTPADAPLHGVAVSADDAVVVMTHNLARDALTLAGIGVRPRFLGLLGPRHRTARVTATLPPGHPAADPHSPVGLDLGGDSPEVIALSIVAQIQGCIRHTHREVETKFGACAT